jgi:tRNA U34 2-thiouridine synthase MnmA/TrmU
MTKVLLVFSGGLDSMLAFKLLERAGVETVGITFASSFFTAEKAVESAKAINLPLIIQDLTEEQLKLVKNPPHGWGKNLNPCIDCHAQMFAFASEYAEQNGFDLIATGEVVGQRPFSQRRQAFEQIEKITGLWGKILRPLSAQLLPATEAEKAGLIKREALENISGRGRKRQLELAKEFKIPNFPTPSGGCILTDPGYSQRGKELLQIFPEASANEFELIKTGRLYFKRAEDDNQLAIIMIGRWQEENQKLAEISLESDFLIKLTKVPGPTGLIRFIPKIDQGELFFKEITEFTKGQITAKSKKAVGVKDLEFTIWQK